jgi:spore maturation protein CgeB
VAELKGFIHPASDTRTRARADARDVKLGLRVATAWPDNVHDPVDDDEVIRLYSRSHVSLGFLEVYERHDPAAPILKHLHLRDFEAPMSGAVYLVDFCDELAEMFEPDREVVVWREPQELVEKARYYGEHPEAGEAIRAAGRARALESHTYQRRFEDLFAALDLG